MWPSHAVRSPSVGCVHLVDVNVERSEGIGARGRRVRTSSACVGSCLKRKSARAAWAEPQQRTPSLEMGVPTTRMGARSPRTPGTCTPLHRGSRTARFAWHQRMPLPMMCVEPISIPTENGVLTEETRRSPLDLFVHRDRRRIEHPNLVVPGESHTFPPCLRNTVVRHQARHAICL